MTPTIEEILKQLQKYYDDPIRPRSLTANGLIVLRTEIDTKLDAMLPGR